MSRPLHYADYSDMPEVVPGVFVEAGSGVYIVDDEGEVVCWVESEWAEDPDAATAMACAVALATKHGASAVRANLVDHGQTLQEQIMKTDREVNGE